MDLILTMKDGKEQRYKDISNIRIDLDKITFNQGKKEETVTDVAGYRTITKQVSKAPQQVSFLYTKLPLTGQCETAKRGLAR